MYKDSRKPHEIIAAQQGEITGLRKRNKNLRTSIKQLQRAYDARRARGLSKFELLLGQVLRSAQEAKQVREEEKAALASVITGLGERVAEDQRSTEAEGQ
ncbi:hypothetical protein LCGC14_2912130 [marine sediment metagenome]|uniref:Uncharacterized protein n=1 Tax=marine sediment metagenome TaxID=412755 RepID=A0A0F8ZYY7_9ZZZZ